MKDVLVEILEGALGIFIVAATIITYLIFGNSNPVFGFDSSLALQGGIGGLLFAILASGVVSILLTIRDQQDVQIRILDQIERSLIVGAESTQEGQVSESPVWTTAKPAPRLSTPPPPVQSSLRRCERCKTILNHGASECQSCGTPIALTR